jgi:hypothetical protein
MARKILFGIVFAQIFSHSSYAAQNFVWRRLCSDIFSYVLWRAKFFDVVYAELGTFFSKLADR